MMITHEDNHHIGDGERMVRQLQRPVNQPSRPWKVREPQRDARCKDCGTEYPNTTRTYCSRCESYTVEAKP